MWTWKWFLITLNIVLMHSTQSQTSPVSNLRKKQSKDYFVLLFNAFLKERHCARSSQEGTNSPKPKISNKSSPSNSPLLEAGPVQENKFCIVILPVYEHYLAEKWNTYARWKGAESSWNYKPREQRPTTNNLDVGVRNGRTHSTKRKKDMMSGLLFSPEKQALQIPNILWGLESNSVEFRAPYGDKVLISLAY